MSRFFNFVKRTFMYEMQEIKLANEALQFGYRRRLRPMSELVTENIARFAYYKHTNKLLDWNMDKKNISGDLCDTTGKKYEVKSVSYSEDRLPGPTSFSPKSSWDELLFVIRTPDLKLMVYNFYFSSADPRWKAMKMSKEMTFEQQCKQGRRPRIVWTEIAKYFDHDLIFYGSIDDLDPNKPREVSDEIHVYTENTMVNTFLVVSDFRESAKYLDRQRLGKQRVEAYQILNNLIKLRDLGEYFGIPPPEHHMTREERENWVRSITSNLDDRVCVIRDGKVQVLDETSRKPWPGSSKIQEGDKIFEQLGKKRRIWYPSYEPKEGDIKITKGFMHHPALTMWVGHEESLKDYINAHIDEWVERGYNNTMEKYEVQNPIRPRWCDDEEIHKNHRASLFLKELSRHEPEWYVNLDLFWDSPVFVDYIWA